YARKHVSKDAFFGVSGSAKPNEKDAYRFESDREQWVTIEGTQLSPGHRFALSLYKIDATGKRLEEIDRSLGIDGAPGIHTRIPKGRYEIVVEQLPFDPTMPELTKDPVGRRLGPALMKYRAAWGDVFPDKVNQKTESDPNRYHIHVSGEKKSQDESGF